MKSLEGIRVLDLSRFLAGPLCGFYLADQGAEVIRIEPPEGGEDRKWALLGPDGENLPFKIFGRNKKGVSLSLKTEKGRELFRQLVKRSDVVLHNTPPGTRLSNEFSYDHLKETNPSIIVGSISGYGQNGPKAGLVGLDFALQAGIGSMVLNGFPEGPPLKTTVPYIDCCAGTACALGIVLALYQREKTGLGQAVDISLFDIGCFITQAVGALMLYQVYDERRERCANFGFSTYMNCLQAKDGWVMVVPSTDPMWARFARAIGREDMIDDPRFKNDMSRWQHTAAIDEIVQGWARPKTVDEILDILQPARIACDRVNRIDELIDDAQVATREMIVWTDFPGLGRLPIPGMPLKLSSSPGETRRNAPGVGEHNEEVYRDLLELTPVELSALRKQGII